MPDDQKPNSQQSSGDQIPPPKLPDSEIAPRGCQQPEPHDGQHAAPNRDKPPSNKSLWKEIRPIDAINCLVGVAMLVVAVAAYRVASDTSDVKSAVRNISTLANQTKRQADFTKGQLDQVRREADAVSGQLDEMKKQTGAFQITASAAQGQLREMQHEQGAVVSVGQVNFARNQHENATEWVITISLQNSGSTPTKNLAIYLNSGPVWMPPFIQIGPPNPLHLPTVPPDPAELISAGHSNPKRISLGPHVTMPVASVRMSDDQLRETVATSTGVLQFVCGIATYDGDVGKVKGHVLKFCYTFRIAELSNFQMQGGKTTVGPVVPTVELCPYWNCTDDECRDDKKRYDAAAVLRSGQQPLTPKPH